MVLVHKSGSVAEHCFSVQNIEGYEGGPHGVVQLSAQTASLKFGLWVNTTKSPRQRTADFPDLGISIEVHSITPAYRVMSCHLLL